MTPDNGKISHLQKTRAREDNVTKGMQASFNPRTNHRENQKSKLMNPERNDSIIDCFTGDSRKKVHDGKSRDRSVSASAHSKSFSNMGGNNQSTGGSNLNEMTF